MTVLTRSQHHAPPYTSAGLALDPAPDRFGSLRSSGHLLDRPVDLRQRMDEDGYLYLPGCLNREEVLDARRTLAVGLAEAGYLEPGSDPMECRAGDPAQRGAWNQGLFGHNGNKVMQQHNPELFHLLYQGRMIEWYERFLGGPVRHYDFTWMRIMIPGAVSPPHCDIVYMGRGTTSVFTSWTPLGDVPAEHGGLMVLENSHKHQRLREGYGRKDVDSYCSNRRGAEFTGMGGGGNIAPGGALSHNPVRLREKLGGRWLSADYSAGDLLVFSMFMVHASLDNKSERIRLSSDSRYQRADEPADERWIGDNPGGHGAGSKRGFVC